MCTIGRISGGTARETYHCGNRKEGALRHGKEETDCGTQRCRNSFLNTTFTPMPPPELFSESPDGKPCNLITRENYEYLRDSFFRYASLMKKEAVHAPGLTMAEGITRLHDEMSDLVGNDMNVNIEQDGERLIFRLWKCHRWGELTLYYFPVKFVENLGPELRRISVTFIHNLMQANGIDTILDEDDTEYALTWLAEENDDEQDDRKKRLKLLHSYEKGRIHSLLRRVERAEGRALCHLQGLRGAEPDGAGAYQRAAERVHQDGRSKGTAGNLRGVRRHHVRHREPAGQGTGQRRQDTHQLGKPAHHELKNGKTNEKPQIPFHRQR